MIHEIDPVIADVYRFFLHEYYKDFKKNLNKIKGKRSHFNVLVSMSVSSYIIENEEELASFLEQFWI